MASFYYLPTVAGNALYAGIFGIYIVVQLYLGIKHKTWGYMLAMVLGLVCPSPCPFRINLTKPQFLEIIGYIARVMIHSSPFNNNDFLMYLVTLTIAPALLTAAIYLCLARIVIVYGQHLSRFKPRTYTLVFCTCDFISLSLQGAGAGLASTAHTLSMSNLGKWIMFAGLCFQVFSLILFGIAAGEFAWRVQKGKGMRNPRYINLASSKLFESFLLGLFVASVTIFARSVYRCVELSGGFGGVLFVSDEAVFMIMGGVMIVLATTCLTLLHPAVAFQGAWHEANFSLRVKKGVQGEEIKMERLRNEEGSGAEYTKMLPE